MFTDKK